MSKGSTTRLGSGGTPVARRCLERIALFLVVVSACAEDRLANIPAPPAGIGSLEGWLCDRSHGVLLTHATITVENHPEITAISDDHGYFVIDQIPPGDHVLLIERGPAIHERAAHVTSSGVTRIGDPACRAETAALTGRICNTAAAEWAAGAAVSVRAASGVQSTTTDAHGYFTLSDVPVGAEELSVVVENTTRVIPLALQPNEVLTVGDRTCGPTGGLLGRICGGDGYWLANALVQIEANDGSVVQTVTAPDGHFRLEGIPAGPQLVFVARGSFSTSFRVDVPTGAFLQLEEPVCIPPTTSIAVITGTYDSIEEILADLGFKARATYAGDIDTEHVIDANANVDIIAGNSTWMANFLGTPVWMARYEIIFFNCGLSTQEILAPSPHLHKYLGNLRQFVQDGGSVYASDWAGELVRSAFPGQIDFVGDDDEFGRARVGNDGSASGSLYNQGLRLALGREMIAINFDLSEWVVAAPHGMQPDTLRVMVRGDVQTSAGDVHDAPLMATFDYGRGRVLYTSFHNEAQSTQDMDDVLNYAVFEL